MGVKATIKGQMEEDIPYIILLKEKGEIKKNKTRHLMRIGYLRTRHCSWANTQFSIRKNTGQYTGFPIAAH